MQRLGLGRGADPQLVAQQLAGAGVHGEGRPGPARPVMGPHQDAHELLVVGVVDQGVVGQGGRCGRVAAQQLGFGRDGGQLPAQPLEAPPFLVGPRARRHRPRTTGRPTDAGRRRPPPAPTAPAPPAAPWPPGGRARPPRRGRASPRSAGTRYRRARCARPRGRPGPYWPGPRPDRRAWPAAHPPTAARPGCPCRRPGPGPGPARPAGRGPCGSPARPRRRRRWRSDPAGAPGAVPGEASSPLRPPGPGPCGHGRKPDVTMGRRRRRCR